MHVMLGVIQYEKNTLCLLPFYIIGAITLVTLHLMAGYKERKADHHQFALQKEGFVYVCGVNDIEASPRKNILYRQRNASPVSPRKQIICYS
jgi:hypothetical protein